MSKSKTVERPDEVMEIERRGSRTGPIAALAAVVALMLGVLAGYSLGNDSDDGQRAHVVEGGEMTERHGQMLDMVDEYVALAKAGDGDAVAAMFTTRGLAEYYADVYFAADGSLAEYTKVNPWNPVGHVVEPIVMDDYRVMFFYEGRAEAYYTNLIEFTDFGELKIVRHVFGVDQTLNL